MEKQIQNLFQWVLVQFVSIHHHSWLLKANTFKIGLPQDLCRNMADAAPLAGWSSWTSFHGPRSVLTVTHPDGLPLCVGFALPALYQSEMGVRLSLFIHILKKKLSPRKHLWTLFLKPSEPCFGASKWLQLWTSAQPSTLLFKKLQFMFTPSCKC